MTTKVRAGQLWELKHGERRRVRHSRIRIHNVLQNITTGEGTATVVGVYNRRARHMRLDRIRQRYRLMALYDHEGHEVPQP